MKKDPGRGRKENCMAETLGGREPKRLKRKYLKGFRSPKQGIYEVKRIALKKARDGQMERSGQKSLSLEGNNNGSHNRFSLFPNGCSFSIEMPAGSQRSKQTAAAGESLFAKVS